MPTVRNMDWKAVVYPTISGVLVLGMIGIITWGQAADRRLTTVQIQIDELNKVTTNCLEELKVDIAAMQLAFTSHSVRISDQIDRLNLRIGESGERLSRIEGQLNNRAAK